jgi:hypothetical protein
LASDRIYLNSSQLVFLLLHGISTTKSFIVTNTPKFWCPSLVYDKDYSNLSVVLKDCGFPLGFHLNHPILIQNEPSLEAVVLIQVSLHSNLTSLIWWIWVSYFQTH